MSNKRDELLKATKKLKELNNEELDFLENENISEKEIIEFSEKKTKLRILIDNHLKVEVLNEKDKLTVKNQLLEILELENKIGNMYKTRLLDIQNGLIYINQERKLREVYGKGGMSFLIEEDKT